MTATAKEQRAAASIYIEKHTALQATFPADFVLALLNDSERLAAIEAVTGEEVRELVEKLRRIGDGFCANVKAAMPSAQPNTIEYRVADALLSLSAKVAEQAEENRAAMAEIDRINGIWKEQSRIIREQAEEIERLKNEREQILLTVFGGEDAPGYAASLGLEDVKHTMEWWHGVLRDQNRLFDVVGRLHTPRPASEYHEDMGSVLWHHMPICEPPYVGSQLDEDWAAHADWYTHFTPLPDCNEINDNATIRAQMEGGNAS